MLICNNLLKNENIVLQIQKMWYKYVNNVFKYETCIQNKS
jgi:hypothetical protein